MRLIRSWTDPARWLPSLLLLAVSLPIPARAAAAHRDRHKPETAGRVVVSTIDYKGWRDCYRLSNGKVQAVIVPAIGGRIMEYSLGGENPFYENRAEAGKVYPITKTWHNYGGFKNWNAPQDVWKWPPDPYLDFGQATVEVVDQDQPAPTLHVTGAVSLESGLLFTRDISMDPGSGDLTVRQRLVNVGGKDQQWSVWDITQVAVPCIVAIPVNAHSIFPGGVQTITDGKNGEDSQWHINGSVLVVRPAAKAGKLGTDNVGGWMVMFRGKLAYLKQIPAHVAGAIYPDKGSSSEVWVDDKLPYLEMEVLSPLFNLSPGAYGELTEQWRLRTLKHAVVTDADVNAALEELGIKS